MRLILSSFSLLALAFYQAVFRVPSATQASACVTFSLCFICQGKHHGQEQNQCRKVLSKNMDAEGCKQIGTIPKKSSTSVFLLPFRSALLWYVLLAFSLELQNPPSSTCSSFLSKYALCPISYHTNCRCDFEWIYQKIKLQWIFHPSRNSWQTIDNSLISPCSSVILAASHWKKGHSYQTLEMILIKMSNTSD